MLFFFNFTQSQKKHDDQEMFKVQRSLANVESFRVYLVQMSFPFVSANFLFQNRMLLMKFYLLFPKIMS
jgi:hypothetical protein